MFILLSDTCIKNKLTRDYHLKLHPGTFQKYQLFLYLYEGPFVYTFEVQVHVPVCLISGLKVVVEGRGGLESPNLENRI
jgi:hypothetical protein